MLEKKDIVEIKEQLLEKKTKLETKLSKMAIKDEDGNWEAKYVDQERDDDVNAIEIEEWTNQTSVVEVLVKDLEAVDIALEKIERNTYGKCEVCETEIPLERLQAFPEARTCTKCTLPE